MKCYGTETERVARNCYCFCHDELNCRRFRKYTRSRLRKRARRFNSFEGWL